MKPTTANPTEVLALEFSRVLRSWLSAEELAEVNSLNATETDKMICHSHDYCDPNQAMLDAMEALGLGDFDPCNEAQTDLLNAAWDMAKANRFYVNSSN